MPIKERFSPEIFKLVRTRELSKRHFDMHPIWSELYDAEEFDEIVSWGVDPAWLAAEIERVHDGSDHAAYPVLQPYPLPGRMRLFMKARLITAGGTIVDGCVMNENAFVLKVFADDQKFTFSRHAELADLNRPELKRLQRALGKPDDPVFPLRYETDFLDHEDQPIAGEFIAGR